MIKMDKKNPPPAWMPFELFFEAELCGSDSLNFVYIKSADSGSRQNYRNIRSVMEEYGKLCGKILPEEEIVPDSYVVIKEEKSFHRAKVSLKDDEMGLVHCFKIDEGCCAVVGVGQVSRITEDLLKIPCSAIKCRLHGLDFFDDLPHLELGFRLIKMAEISLHPFYSVEVLGFVDLIPHVNMSRRGMSLVNDIQKFISILCEPHVPKVESMFEGEVLYANYKACVWFKKCGDDALSCRIIETLNRYQKLEKQKSRIHVDLFSADIMYNSMGNSTSSCGRSSSLSDSTSDLEDTTTNPEWALLPEELWKEKYLLSLTGIFITEFFDELYRVKLIRLFPKNQVEVEFIDYGNRQIISRRKLIPVRKIDENLAFIPPQCIKARLHGFYRINTNHFWRLMSSQDSPTVNIMIMNQKGDEEFGIEVEIFNIGSEISINESWRTSSPENLVLCNLKPIENSTGAERAKHRVCTSPLGRARGALYKSQRLQILLARSNLPCQRQ